MSEVAKKQAVSGFRVVSYSTKNKKDQQVFRIVLEAVVDDIGCGEKDLGDFQKGLMTHQSSETEIALSLFME